MAIHLNAVTAVNAHASLTAERDQLRAALGEAVQWLRHIVPEQMADTKPGTAYRINRTLAWHDAYGPAVGSFVSDAAALAGGVK